MSAAVHAIKFAVKVLYRYGAIFRPPGIHDFSCLSCVHLRSLIVPSFYLFIFLHALSLVGNLYIFLKRVCFWIIVVKKERRTMTELGKNWISCCIKFWRIFDRSFWSLLVSILKNRILACLIGKAFRFLKKEYSSLVILNIGEAIPFYRANRVEPPPAEV